MASILDRLLPRRSSALAGQVRVTSGYRPVSEVPGELWGRPRSTAGVRVDEHEALTLSAVWAACFRLANIAAMLPLGVYRKDDRGRTEQPDHPAARLLGTAPNPEQTAFTARHFMQFWKPLFGAACAEIGWDGAGRPSRLWPLEPWRVRPDWDDDNVLYFRVDGTRRVAAEDMLYVPHVTEDGVTGKGFVEFALESLGQAIAADRSAGRFFQNDMKPGGLLQHDGNPDPKARKEFREAWAQNHGGVENRGKVGVLWGGWKWVTTGMQIDPDKAQLLECTTPDTLVGMADGTRKPAGEVRAGDVVFGFDAGRLALIPSRVERVADNGTQPTVRIRTHRGREIVVTKNHPFWASKRLRNPKAHNSYQKTASGLSPGWIFAEHLAPGDYVAAGVGVVWAGTGEVSASDAYLIGAMVGDGHIRKGGCMAFANADPAVVGAVSDALAVHGAELRWKSNVNYEIKANCAVGRPRKGTRNNRIRALFADLGLEGTDSATKFVPDAIFRSGPAAVRAFLAGYIDTDGTVSRIDTVKAGLVVITTASRDLADGTQHALSLIGVNASVRFQSGVSSFDQPYTRWEIVVAGRRNVRRLAGEVCLIHPQKRERLATHASRDAREEKADFAAFDRIVSVEDAGELPTIAITVEGTHSHVTSGLVSHNTRQFSVVEVARWLNVPPHWLAELGRATWNNVEQQSIEALLYSISPMLVATEQEYDRKLLAPPRLYCKHAVNAMLRTDAKTRGEFYRLMREIGAYTANQVLAYEDENGIGPDGDRRFVPVNWQPADDLMTGGEAQAAAAKAAAAAKPPAASPDGNTPPETKPAAPKLSAGPNPAVVAALAGVAEHAAGMLLRKELNEARRAAKSARGLTQWMDEFYAGFEGTLAAGLLATAGLALAVKGAEATEETPAQLAGVWAASWVKTSRGQLLAAMECKAEEWPSRSAALFQLWEGRAGEAAARIAEGVRDAAG